MGHSQSQAANPTEAHESQNGHWRFLEQSTVITNAHWVCDGCNRSFPDEKAMKLHKFVMYCKPGSPSTQLSTMIEDRVCEICNREFPDYESRNRHRLVVYCSPPNTSRVASSGPPINSAESLRCPICARYLSTQQDLQNHSVTCLSNEEVIAGILSKSANSTAPFSTSTAAKKEGGGRDCPLCMEEMTDLCNISCGHVFCPQCIANALSVNGRCPVCRSPAEAKDIRRVYL